MDQSLVINILGEDFIFDCRRAIYWPKHKVLLAADLHWGKTQYLRSHGVAISDHVFDADLIRLSKLFMDYDVKTFLVLGDLIHHELALNHSTVLKVAKFRDQHPVEVILLKGNHDRYTIFPESWGIVEENDFYIDQFLFAHEYQKKVKAYQFSGHVHPMFRIKSGFDNLRLPSFILTKTSCLLPAYSFLTGGQDIKIQKGEKAIVLMEDGLELFEKK